MVERQRQPGKDLLSRIVADPEGKFTANELVGMTVQLISIGIAPTNTLLTDIVYLLLTDDRLAPVRPDPTRIDDAFDDLCRYAPDHQRLGPGLVATTDVEVGGVTIPAGDVVSYSYSSGNHDPRRFPIRGARPETQGCQARELRRRVHACIAQHFSRLVVTTAV